MYNCVQNLLTAQLKPELLLDGAVDRLIELGKSAGDRLDDVDDEEDDDDDNDNDSSLTMSNRGDDDDDGLDDSSSFAMLTKKNMKMAAGGHAAPAVAKKEPKTPWTEDDVKLMVRLKDFDRLTHEEVAVSFVFSSIHIVHLAYAEQYLANAGKPPLFWAFPPTPVPNWSRKRLCREQVRPGGQRGQVETLRRSLSQEIRPSW